MINAVEIHDRIFNYLIEEQKKNSSLLFGVRSKNNKNRLNKGLWFTGDEDRYLSIPFTRRMSGNLTTKSICLNIHFKEEKPCSLMILFKSETNSKIINCYQKIISQVSGLNRINDFEFIKTYDYEDYLEGIKEFLLKDKPIIDSVIKSNNLEDDFSLDDKTVQKKIKTIIDIKKGNLLENNSNEEDDCLDVLENNFFVFHTKETDRNYFLDDIISVEGINWYEEVIKPGDIIFYCLIGNTSNYIKGFQGIAVVHSKPYDSGYSKPARGNPYYKIDIKPVIRFPEALTRVDLSGYHDLIDMPFIGLMTKNEAFQVGYHLKEEDELQNVRYLIGVIRNIFPELKLELDNLFGSSFYIDPGPARYIKGSSHFEITSFDYYPVINLFIEWSQQKNNYNKSYQGIFYYEIIKSWGSFSNYKIFEFDPFNPDESFKFIEQLILDDKNHSWNDFKSSNHGTPSAIMGKKNYLKFLKELCSDEAKLAGLKSLGKRKRVSKTFNDVLFNEIKDQPRNLIIYGAPGTGKSYELNRRVLTNFPDEILRTRITFHPNYNYRNFLGTYKPSPLYKDSELAIYNSKGTDNEEVKREPVIDYVFEPGPFMQSFLKAYHNPNHNFVLIIEELNRANAPAVFGELFQLLDREADGSSTYSVRLEEAAMKYLRDNDVNDEDIRMPRNLYIWATMNNADQGVLPLDAAFKRRWSFEHIGLNDNEEEAKGYINFKFIPPGKQLNWNKFRRELNTYLIETLKIHEDKLIAPFFLREQELKDENAIKNKLLLYLKEDVLKYKDGLFNAQTFSQICETYIKGGVVFNEDFGIENHYIPKDDVTE